MLRRYLIFFFVLWGCSKSANSPKEGDQYYLRVNVKDYGAIGNGVTNDTRAFEIAMNKADSLKLPVYIPIGVYKVNLLFSHDNLQIIGEKQPGENVTDGSVIFGKIDCNYKKNIIIENIGIDSRKQLSASDDAALTSGGIADTLILNQQFRNLSIIGDGFMGYKHGILCQAGSGISIKNVIVSLFYHGIAIRSSNVRIDSISANYCGNTSIVVKSDHGDNLLTENVSINHVNIKGDPINLYNRGGSILVMSFGDMLSQTRNVTVQNVHSTYGGEACVSIQQVQGVVNNITIQNCQSDFQGDNNTRACFDVTGGSNIIFSNCTSNNSLGYGFRSSGTVHNIRVQNSFEKNSGVGAWTGNYTYLQLNGIEIIK